MVWVFHVVGLSIVTLHLRAALVVAGDEHLSFQWSCVDDDFGSKYYLTLWHVIDGMQMQSAAAVMIE